MADKDQVDAVASQSSPTHDSDPAVTTSTLANADSKTNSSNESKKDKVAAPAEANNTSDTKADGEAKDEPEVEPTTESTTESAPQEDQANGHSANGDPNGDSANGDTTNGVKDEDKDSSDKTDTIDKNDVVKDMEKKEEEMDEKVDKETEAAGQEAVGEDESVVEQDESVVEEPEPEPEASSRDQSVADVTMADTTTDSIDGGDSAAFPPGTVVLAKVKGFPAWPGMVVPEDVLPASVLNAKPRKNRQMWPVRFFIDTSHTWAYRNDLKPLGVEEAAKFLKATTRGRKDKSLHAAYKVASEPPTLDEFVEQVYGHGEDEELEEEEEEEEELEEKPPAKKRKTVAKAAPASKSKASAVKEAIKEAKKKSGQPVAKDSGKGDAKETAGGAKGGAGAKADAKAGSKSASASPALSSKPKSSPAPKRSDKEGKVLVIRHKLQRGLLSGSVPDDSELPGLSQYLTRLEEFEGLETSIIRQTKINKVLKGIVKLESVPKDEEYGFKERSLKLLTAWNKLE